MFWYVIFTKAFKKTRKELITIDDIYRLFYNDLLNFSMSLDYSFAYDIVSETFCRAIKNQSVFEELNIRQQKAWLFKTARNIFVDMIRKSSREIITEIFENAIYKNDDYINLLISDLKLNSDEQKLLLLRYVHGYNSNEIGAMLDLNPQTVRWKLHQIKKKAQKELEDYE